MHMAKKNYDGQIKLNGRIEPHGKEDDINNVLNTLQYHLPVFYYWNLFRHR